MEIIGIIDCHSPSVQDDILTYLDRGEMVELEGGGIRYRDTTVMLGCELKSGSLAWGGAFVSVYAQS